MLRYYIVSRLVSGAAMEMRTRNKRRLIELFPNQDTLCRVLLTGRSSVCEMWPITVSILYIHRDRWRHCAKYNLSANVALHYSWWWIFYILFLGYFLQIHLLYKYSTQRYRLDFYLFNKQYRSLLKTTKIGKIFCL